MIDVAPCVVLRAIHPFHIGICASSFMPPCDSTFKFPSEAGETDQTKTSWSTAANDPSYLVSRDIATSKRPSLSKSPSIHRHLLH